MLTIGDRLRIARDLKGVKQIKASDDTGINNKTLSGYERNISEPDIDTIKILAEYYNVSLDYLLGKTDNPAPYNEDSKKKHPKSTELIEYVIEEAGKQGYNLKDKSKEELAEIIVKALKIDEITKSN